MIYDIPFTRLSTWQSFCDARNSKMKRFIVIFACLVLMIAGLRFANNTIAPLLLNSRIERLNEKNLPSIQIEKKGAVYCRMKADDFEFPLPPGTWVVNSAVTGGFDTVDGSVEVRFDPDSQMSPSEYEKWLSGKIPEGGSITAEQIPGGLLIKFYYFGDR